MRRAAEAFGWPVAWDLAAPIATDACTPDPLAVVDLVLAQTPPLAERARRRQATVALVPNA